MVNLIWLIMMISGILVAALKGNIEQVTTSALQAAEVGIEVAIYLMGIMSLWLGLMNIADKAGLVKGLARIFSPVLRVLFPSLKAESPAFGAIVMNLCANILG